MPPSLFSLIRSIFPEILDKFKKKDPRKVELFLYLLVTDDLLYHHYKLKSTLDVLDEKIKIASYLKSKFPEFNYLQVNKVAGLPFTVVELKEKINKIIYTL